ncbi:uncharacterized protein LOC131844306 [Achroia grisella]|uniref:uncharacterized protein LOC131844306 n=1 Tax=Achroia grisella TaxID=688607 RepID=UPI0027D2A74A|nr:uncharacterized protein LOC131844306 [Achroia grisella]
MTTLVLIVTCLLSIIKCQYISMNRKLESHSVSCDNNKTVLVEHFFNVIFTEFHQTPPICVCVQMCIDQPTYCYPNGCLKKADSKRNVAEDQPINHSLQEETLQSENNKPAMFLVDKRDHMTHYLSEKYMNNNLLTKEKPSVKDLHLDPFDSRYKIIYSNKKVPKIEFRYDLKQHVNNMKSKSMKLEAIDITKTRWPLNQHNIHVNGPKSYKTEKIIGENRRYDVIQHTDFRNKHFYPSKYFKRDIAMKNHGEDIDRKTICLIDKRDSDKDITGFSLETLINNLIDNSFELANNTEFDLNIKRIDPEYINVNTDSLNYTREVQSKLNEDAVNIFSKNSTNSFEEHKQVNDMNLFREDNFRNIYNEMIVSLSKQIEKQNNTSLGLMEYLVENNKKIATEQISSTESDKTTISVATTPSTESTLEKLAKNITVNGSLENSVHIKL